MFTPACAFCSDRRMVVYTRELCLAQRRPMWVSSAKDRKLYSNKVAAAVAKLPHPFAVGSSRSMRPFRHLLFRPSLRLSYCCLHLGNMCLLALLGRRDSLEASACSPSASLASTRHSSSRALYCIRWRCGDAYVRAMHRAGGSKQGWAAYNLSLIHI